MGLTDVFTHIGHQNDIISYGIFSEDNFYPILHILVVNISLISGIKPFLIMKYFLPFFTLFFIISFYLLNRELFKQEKAVLFSTALASTPFLFGYYSQLIPNSFSIMLVPFILFLYFKSRNEGNKFISLLTVIFLIWVPFAHPLTTILLLLTFITVEISNWIYNASFTDGNYKISMEIPLILLITFFTWISTSFVLKRSLSKFSLWINGDLTAPSELAAQSLNKLNLSIWERVLLFIKMYGPDVLIVCFSFIAVLALLKHILNHKNNGDDNILFVFTGSFVIISAVLFLFILTGDPNIQAMRSLNYVFLIAIPLSGYGLYEIFNRSSQFISRNKSKILLTFLIMIVFISGSLIAYPSPYIERPSPQATMSQIIGMDFFYSTLNQSIEGIRLPSASPWRYSELIFGIKKASEVESFGKYDNWIVVPNHLGYDSNSYMGSILTEKKYFPILNIDKLSYTNIWKEYGAYTENDFNKMEQDITCNKYYSNGNVDIWLIYPI